VSAGAPLAGERSQQSGQTTAPSSQSVLELAGLHVWFDAPDGRSAHAVRGVDLAVRAGERVGVLGESGCGKTTMILAAMGLLPSFASVGGAVRLDGIDVLARGEQSARAVRWTHAAMVFQGAMSAMNPVYRVGKQIADPMVVHGRRPAAQARQRTAELLELVGLPASVARRYPHELSGGMRQRAVIAMALACDPKVLFADEPTTALDVVVQAQIGDLLADLADRLGLALVMVTHDIGMIAETSARAVVMYAGVIVEDGPTIDVLTAPRHPYTRLLLEATPVVNRDRPLVSIPGTPPRLDEAISGCAFAARCPHVFETCSVRPRLCGDGHVAACHALEQGRLA
jgi:peptide/nickel transport system ATP-binding protein